MKDNSLSIIIATKDRLEHLSKCIRSILNQTVLPDEIIIVDGSTEKDLLEPIRSLFPMETINLLKYIKAKPNANKQRNIGINNSRSDLLTLLDDDTVLDKKYVYFIRKFFREHRENNIGALSCKIVNPDSLNKKKPKISVGNIISKFFMLWSKGDGKFQLSGIPTLIDTNCNKNRKVEFIYGGNSTIPRYVFNKFQFDENLPCRSQMEDDDFAYRVSKVFQNYWTPKAFLYHKSHYTNNNRYYKSKSFIINHFYLKNKNHPTKFKNRIAFYWSVLGKIFLELYIAVKNKNISGVYGSISGFYEVLINKKHLHRIIV